MGEDTTAIDRLRTLFKASNNGQDYEPVDSDYDGNEDVRRPVLIAPEADGGQEFSWFEYSIFLLLGIAMLWAWNMFLAAAPYFQTRFANNKNILDHFQPAITSVGCVTNLVSILVLGQMQAKASYPKRILCALVLNCIVFTLLSISVTYFRSISATGYFVFTLFMVFSTSLATGLCQNGAFAFASSFGRPEYIQAIMTGQAVAGVLPSVAQILSVLAVPVPDNSKEETAGIDHTNTTSATVYFSTATVISFLTLFAVLPLIRKHNRLLESQMMTSITSIEEAERANRKVVSMLTLYKKLHWLAASVFICFAVTMFFPVFTQKIVSNVPQDKAPRIFQPSAFIPLGFLFWNVGDLTGRLITLGPLNMGNRPVFLFVAAIVRAGFLPVYLLCNIVGKGAVIKSDLFYLIAVQFLFGVSNGWLGSCCMMGAGDYVDEGEREAAGGFMAINLVGGLTFGSLLSFAAAGVK
ncbi:related to intracellular membrane protein involved in nucleoside transport [Rhynchosporium graminicola]|uniref:Related to intracellular membrane protein involved in nucleoside transport n=1 Tax=Rhynchosporium graminicola TaxID=2792576 RepID=A0A1E1LSQ7_9HELO|nr:related to intracellular membrane protein involved in nucleoside transport [Rhynchosporium commune]